MRSSRSKDATPERAAIAPVSYPCAGALPPKPPHFLGQRHQSPALTMRAKGSILRALVSGLLALMLVLQSTPALADARTDCVARYLRALGEAMEAPARAPARGPPRAVRECRRAPASAENANGSLRAALAASNTAATNAVMSTGVGMDVRRLALPEATARRPPRVLTASVERSPPRADRRRSARTTTHLCRGAPGGDARSRTSG